MREQWLKEMLRDGTIKVETPKPEPKQHTVRGGQTDPNLFQYGVPHDYDCPGCEGTNYLTSPRSETYWSM